MENKSHKSVPFPVMALESNGELNFESPPVRTSNYAHYYKRWMRHFRQDQLLLVDGQELRDEPWTSVQKVEKFLGLEPQVKQQNFIFNETKGFFCVRVGKNGSRCLSSSKGRKHIQVSDNMKTKLRALYQPLNQNFYELVGNNYHWNE